MENLNIFKNVNIDKYKNKLVRRKYKKNSLVFSEGEICNHLGIIISGQLTISTLSSSNEYIINTLNRNDMFGDTLLFKKNKEYLGDGIVTIDCEILLIEKELLLELFKEQEFLLNYLELNAEKNATVRNRLKLYSQKTISDRILFYLNSETKKLKTNIIPILSKEDLAMKLNIPRPSLSRELIKLKEQGIINYNKNLIELKKLAGH